MSKEELEAQQLKEQVQNRLQDQELVRKKREAFDETKIWGEIPKKVELETIFEEKIEVKLRFPAKKELQVVSLIRTEMKNVESDLTRLIEDEELRTVDQIGIVMDYIPNLAIKVASVLIERDPEWIEENLSLSEISKVVKPFFMSWLSILEPTQLGGLLSLARP